MDPEQGQSAISLSQLLRRDSIGCSAGKPQGQTNRTTRRIMARSEEILGQFAGFSDAAVDNLTLLNGGTEAIDVDRKRLKYGRTRGAVRVKRKSW